MMKARKKRSSSFRRKAALKARARASKKFLAHMRKTRAYRIKLDRQGYDDRGKYYGVGEKLWAVDDADRGIVLRAPSMKAAKEIFVQRVRK